MQETSPTTDGPAAMSTPETLGGIFMEPGRTFAALRERPRFLVAAVIVTVAVLAFTFLLYQKIGYENVVRQTMENSPRTADMDPDQRERAIAMQTGPVFKVIAYVSPIIGVAIVLSAGAGLYLLGVMLMGKVMSYKQSLAVWTYSSLPPAVLVMLLNVILLFLKPAEDIDPTVAQRGLVRANLGLLVSGTEHPILSSALGAMDLFAIYGLVLAVIGLKVVARLSTGAAAGIAVGIWLIGVLIRIAFAAFSGSAVG